MVVSESAADANESLSSLTRAHHAIMEASSLGELKGIRDKAEAARKYAQAAGMGLEIQNYAAEVKLRAERRAGSLIAKLNLHGGDRREETSQERLTLSDIGVSKDQSSRWQLTATVPERTFEKFVEQTREENGEVTTAGLVRLANELRAKQKRKRRSEPDPVSNCRVVDTIEQLRADEQKFACVYVDAPWPGGADNEHFAAVLGEIPLELMVERIETRLTTLIEQKQPKEFYSTAEVAELLGRAEFTVREWGRLGRVLAEKRACGRGSSKEWMISNVELERIRNEGLLPL